MAKTYVELGVSEINDQIIQRIRKMRFVVFGLFHYAKSFVQFEELLYPFVVLNLNYHVKADLRPWSRNSKS